jgi:hypothetical protein
MRNASDVAHAQGLSSCGIFGRGRYVAYSREGRDYQEQRCRTREEAEAWAQRWRSYGVPPGKKIGVYEDDDD